MRSKLSIYNYEKILYLTLIPIFAFRVFYSLTRNIFSSGPDAPFYAVAPVELAKFGFLSNQIKGVPYYPLGYPMLLSPFAKLNQTHWIYFAQIFQVILSILTVYFTFTLVRKFGNEVVAFIAALLMLFYPSFSAMSGQAMYEPVLMFFFYSYLFLVFQSSQLGENVLKIVLIGTLGGIAVVVHPRVIPWVLIIQVILFKRIGIRNTFIILGSCIPIPLLIMLRNLFVNEKFTLMSSKIVDPYGVSTNIQDKVINGFTNIYYFWTPLSGDARHTTWYHNFTLFHELKKITGSTSTVVYTSSVILLLSVTAWLFGCYLWSKEKPEFAMVLLLIPVLAMFTDFIAAGDSRHRLVVMPLILIAQAKTIVKILHLESQIPQFRLENRRNL
jgi:hypothetical protein